MKILILILAGAFAAFAQTSTQNTFVSTTGDVSLTASATAATLQQSALNSATGAKDIGITAATVFCSVACTATHTINSGAATATAGTPTAQPGNTSAAPTATFWTASNASGGTTLRVDHVPAGGTFTYTYPASFKLPRSGTGSNYTISIAAITGTANISIQHMEPIN